MIDITISYINIFQMRETSIISTNYHILMSYPSDIIIEVTYAIY